MATYEISTAYKWCPSRGQYVAEVKLMFLSSDQEIPEIFQSRDELMGERVKPNWGCSCPLGRYESHSLQGEDLSALEAEALELADNLQAHVNAIVQTNQASIAACRGLITSKIAVIV